MACHFGRYAIPGQTLKTTREYEVTYHTGMRPRRYVGGVCHTEPLLTVRDADENDGNGDREYVQDSSHPICTVQHATEQYMTFSTFFLLSRGHISGKHRYLGKFAIFLALDLEKIGSEGKE